MAFKDFPGTSARRGIAAALARTRAPGSRLPLHRRPARSLEGLARTLAKTLNCLHPVKRGGVAVDCCDRCLNCQKIEHGNHADVFWVRPESKLRQIKIGQIVRREDSPPRVLLDAVESQAHREPIQVRHHRRRRPDERGGGQCLPQDPGGAAAPLGADAPDDRAATPARDHSLPLPAAELRRRRAAAMAPAQMEWLAAFSEMAAAEQRSLMGRYRLMDVLLRKLNEVRRASRRPSRRARLWRNMRTPTRSCANSGRRN